MSNFNFIAPVYDRLVRLVFGGKLWKAQRTHLHLIQPAHEVLILGGGTGRILNWLPECEITYLEQSSEMMRQARRAGNAKFIQSDFLRWETNLKYDWVICPFFLDCFPFDKLGYCVQRIIKILDKGNLLVVDFTPADSLRQSLLLRTMHVFFRLFTGLESKRLMDIHAILIENGLREVKYCNDGMIFSAVYSPQ